MDYEGAPTLTYSDGTPEPEPWLNSSYLRGRDNHYTELHSQSQRSVALSSQTSGYFSTNGSVYNSTRRDNRPDSCHSVAYRRESLTSQDTGSTICYYNFIGSTVHLSTTPTTSLPGVQDEIHFFPEGTANMVRRPRKIISRRNEELLNEFTPQLVDSMDPQALLPHLMRYGLADTHDQDYITNPFRTNRDRSMHIIRTAPYKNPSAFEHFVECLEAVHVGPHSELARQLRREMRKPSSAQLRPMEATAITQDVYYQEEPNRLQLEGLQLASNDGAGLVDERLLESPTHEWEPFRHHQSSDSERLSSHSSSSELSESMLIPIQPCLSTNTSERTMYESMLQQYPERDIGPKSPWPVASCDMRRESNVTKERRQNDRGKQADVSHNDFSHKTCKMIMRRKLTWLQENTVIFNSDHEEIKFTSLTNCQQKRKVLHYGTLFQQGKMRFVVLLTDFLLVLNLLEPRDHSRKAVKRQSFEDHMFSDNKYATNKPLLLHHFEIQDYNKQQCSFSLHCKLTSVDLCFEAPSKTARDVWLDALSGAIKDSCGVQRKLRLLIGNETVERINEHNQWLSLTILKASDLIWLQRHDYCRRLFCTVMLGQNQKCRTPSVEGKNNASWNFTFEFWRFVARDTLEIEVWQENTFRPNDCLGYICIPIRAVTDMSTDAVHPGHVMEAALPLKPTGSGEIDFKICT